jgi:deferrochelatase/peroxidase EfeB
VGNPETHYIPMQTRLSAQDGLMDYLQHRGSALFAVPPGTREGGYAGDSLFG